MIVVREFKKVVDRVSDVMTASLKAKDDKITGVHYLHGHPLDVAKILQDKNGTSYAYQKYPAIILLQDFPEKKGLTNGFDLEVNLHVLICRGTVASWLPDQRYERNFEPFLYPVYDEFLKALTKSQFFVTQTAAQIKHTKIDRLFWGTENTNYNTKNIFLDHLDIIEIKDLKLFCKNYC